MGENTALIRIEENGTLGFGDYTLAQKAKQSDFEFHGDLYKIKTFHEITKLERNGMFVYESVPGTTVTAFDMTDEQLAFTITGKEDVQITLEVEEEQEYEVTVAGESAGTMKANLGGKLTIGVELNEGEAVSISVKKR